MIVGKLSDVTYRVQVKKGSMAFVVHGDRLKPYDGEPLKVWTYRPKQPAEVPVSGEGPVETAELVERETEIENRNEVSRKSGLSVKQTDAGTNDSNETECCVNENKREVPTRYPQRELKLPLRFRDSH